MSTNVSRLLPGLRCITFDLDDTLWPLKKTMVNAERKLKAYLESSHPDYVEAFDHKVLGSLRKKLLISDPSIATRLTELRFNVYAEALEVFGVEKSIARKIAQEAVELFLYHRNEVEPFAGVEDILEKLASNYVLGAITNGNVRFELLPIARHFAFYVSAEQVGAAKPEPEIFRRALELGRLKDSLITDKSQVLHVGDDLETDIYGANRFGFESCWFNPDAKENYGPASDKEWRPRLTIKNLTELLSHLQ